MRHVLLLCSALSLIYCTSAAQVWQPLGEGLTNSPVAMTEARIGITVAYKIIDKGASGVLFGISTWNGSSWVKHPTLKCDSGARINSIKWYKEELYVAGQFNSLNAIVNARSLVKLSKRSTYVNVPNISTGAIKHFETIFDLNIYNDLLVVAGQFSSTVVANSANLGFFNGEKWVTSGIKVLESGVSGAVITTLSSGDDLYIGGVFTRIGTTQSKYMARFKKGELIPFKYNYARPIHLIEYNKGVVAVGTINAAETSMYFFAVDGDTVKKMMTGFDQVTYVSDVVAAGDVIYASGIFKLSGDQTTYTIVKYEDEKWTPLAVGQLDNVKNLLYRNGILAVIGDFKSYGGIRLNQVAVLTTQKNYAIISGTVYHDKEDNCKFDNRDEKLSKNLIRIQPGNRVIRPNLDGQYKIYLEEGNYTITVTPNKYWRASSCAKLTQTVVVKAGDVKRNVDFPLVQQSNIKDLSVKLTASSGPRAIAANVQQYYINYENLGSSELVEGIVELVFDKNLEKFIASPPPLKVEGDTAYWSIHDLSPGENGIIKCLFKVKDNAGDFIELTTTIVQNAAEEDDDNNSSSLTQKIMPEDEEVRKYVNPESTWSDTAFINPGAASMTYQISFANYTEDTVRSVTVIDTVDLNNTIWEIRDVSWSHPVIPTTLAGPKYSDYSILIYQFQNINLPPNPTKNGEIVNDEGHIAFSMMLNNNLQIGMAFTNRARVLFDYELDELTNEVMALVEEESSVINITKSASPLTVYPNPTESTVTLDVDFHQLYPPFIITTLMGSEVLSGGLSLDQTIDLSNLVAGVYFISLTTESGFYSAKIIKQ